MRQSGMNRRRKAQLVGMFACVMLILTNPQGRGDSGTSSSPVVAAVEAGLREFERRNNRIMTPAEFNEVVAKHQDRIFHDPDADRLLRSVLRAYANARPPGMVQPLELAAIFKAKRQTIDNCQFRYTKNRTLDAALCEGVYSISPDTDPKTLHQRIHFAQSGAKLFRTVAYGTSSHGQGDDAPTLARAFDGEVEVSYNRRVNAANRHKPSSLNWYYRDDDHWLPVGAMLGDKQAGTTMLSYLDFAGLIERLPELVYVEPETTTLDGREMLVVTQGMVPPLNVYYLDVERNFAPSMLEHKTEVDGVAIIVRYKGSEFQDMGNGLWLPQKVTMECLREGADGQYRAYLTETYEAEQMAINAGVDDSLFDGTSIVPIGARMNDRIAGIDYRFGLDDDATQEALQDAVESVRRMKKQKGQTENADEATAANTPEADEVDRRPIAAEDRSTISQISPLRLFLVAVVAVMLVLGCVLVFRKRRLRRDQRN
ncbi:MAG TPA: hypothetical protein VMZ31_06925 [Phycisphaerae bacterium]|nr:hypothetical protein [Phycisphaerae bacterium]